MTKSTAISFGITTVFKKDDLSETSTRQKLPYVEPAYAGGPYAPMA